VSTADVRPARASAVARLVVWPSGDDEGRTAAWWPWAVVAAAVGWNLVNLRALRLGVAYLNDNSLHEQMVRFATAQLRAGKLPLTSWFPYLGAGSPQFLHYQSLPAVLTGLAGLVVGPDVAFRWSLYLLLSLWPISIYLSARLFGGGRSAAAASAAMAPFLVSAAGVGYEQHAYLSTGFGVWTQLWAMWTLPLAWGLSWRAIRDGRGCFTAVLFTALTVALHFETGYLALSVLIIWPFVAGRPLVARLRRAAVLLGGSLLASAWVIVPLLQQRNWAAVNEPLQDTGLVNGYGARVVLDWLVSGQLLDDGRLPVVTAFAALGFGLAWLAWSSAADARALLVAFAVCLLLAFGRTTFGWLVDVIPGGADLFFRRFMMGVQLVALLLAGRGAVWLAAGCVRLLPARVSRWPRYLSPLVVFVAAIAVLAPAWLQLDASDRADSTAVAAQRHADDTQGADVDRLITVIRRDGGGRTYAGMPSNWGQSFTVGAVPVFKYLESRDVDEVGYTLRTASLMTDPEYFFDDSDPPTTGCSESAISSCQPDISRRCPRGRPAAPVPTACGRSTAPATSRPARSSVRSRRTGRTWAAAAFHCSTPAWPTTATTSTCGTEPTVVGMAPSRRRRASLQRVRSAARALTLLTGRPPRRCCWTGPGSWSSAPPTTPAGRLP
jgi:hypothetical protein